MVYFAATLLVALMAVSIASAGLGDWLKSTGKLSSQLTNVTVAVSGTNIAQIVLVTPTDPVTLIEYSNNTVTVAVRVRDSDGANDVNDTSVFANFTKTGETTRSTASYCVAGADIDATTASYTCTLHMWYWDAAGTWNVGIRANDLGNKTEVYNTTATFTVNSLKAMVISPPALTWSAISSGATDQSSNNDPTVVNNTGNYNGTIQLTAQDLQGETNPADTLPANNFTSAIVDPSCAGDILVDDTPVTITSSAANRGNLTAGSGAGQEELYHCIPLVPSIPSQTYSTVTGGSWTVAYP